MTKLKTRDPETRAAIGRRLRALRIAYGARQPADPNGGPYSIRRYCRALRVHHETYRCYEIGVNEPPLTMLQRIRDLTGCSLDMLIVGDTHGSASMIPANGLEEGELTVGQRLRMVREILEPALTKVAALMRVDPDVWLSWESDAEQPMLAKMLQFSHQFGDRAGFGLDFLYRGVLLGVTQTLLVEILARHPNLEAHQNGTSTLREVSSGKDKDRRSISAPGARPSETG